MEEKLDLTQVLTGTLWAMQEDRLWGTKVEPWNKTEATVLVK